MLCFTLECSLCTAYFNFCLLVRACFPPQKMHKKLYPMLCTSYRRRPFGHKKEHRKMRCSFKNLPIPAAAYFSAPFKASKECPLYGPMTAQGGFGRPFKQAPVQPGHKTETKEGSYSFLSKISASGFPLMLCILTNDTSAAFGCRHKPRSAFCRPLRGMGRNAGFPFK